MRARPWLIINVALVLGFILWWVVDNYKYDSDLEKDAAYERMVSV